MSLRIPSKENLIPLNFEYIDDTIAQYYRPFQGYFMRKRLDLAIDILKKNRTEKVEKLLDIGYGGGTFLVSLSDVANDVHAIDLHDKMPTVNKILEKEKVTAKLYQASVFALPFEDHEFDRLTCISVLEHFKGDELDRSLVEIKRVLKKDGKAVIGFPTKNIISNFIIKHILGFEPDDIHPSGHNEVLSAIKRNFTHFKYISYPSFLPLNLALYVVVEFNN